MKEIIDSDKNHEDTCFILFFQRITTNCTHTHHNWIPFCITWSLSEAGTPWFIWKYLFFLHIPKEREDRFNVWRSREKAGGKKRHGGYLWPQHVAVAAVRRWGRKARRLVKGLGPLQESRRLPVSCIKTTFGLRPRQGVFERLVDRHRDRMLLQTAITCKCFTVTATAATATAVTSILVSREQNGIHGLQVVL